MNIKFVKSVGIENHISKIYHGDCDNEFRLFKI